MIKKIALAFVFIIASIVLAFCYLLEMHMDGKHIRLNDNIVTIQAVYLNMTGDPKCTKIYREDNGAAIFTNIPADLPNPNCSDELVNNDKLYLKGYMYKWQKINKITRNIVDERDINVIDVIEWGVNNKTKHKTAMKSFDESNFVSDNYTDCSP
ncbi:MAG: hypothetical protein GY799_29280 [Desulfobulbaceae bacterium]|nr:hypothetical protein [Desulfobulbaceae bacterium]